MAIGCVIVAIQRGQIITGSVRRELDHLERQLPAPMTIDARNSMTAAAGRRTSPVSARLSRWADCARLRRESAEVDDAPHAGAGRRAAEVLGGAPVELREIRPAVHGVHEIVGNPHARQRTIERVFVEAVPWTNLRRRAVA